jgi:hypothetical protein
MPKTEEADSEEVDSEHDHEHDHDHEHAELTEEEREQAEADVARMSDALAALDDDGLQRALTMLNDRARTELAGQLHLPRAAAHLGDALVPLVRRKLRSASPDRQLQATFTLVEKVNDECVAKLGDRSEDPSKDDMLEVLPEMLEKYPPTLVTLMLAGYAASDAQCRPVMRELLDTDERFTIGPAIDVEETTPVAAPAKVVDDKELAAKREQRRAAKDAKRAAEARARDARAGAEAKRRAALHEAKRKGK